MSNTLGIVPPDKMSKRQRRAYFAEKRNGWNGVKPATRIIPDKRQKMINRIQRDVLRDD